MQKQELVRFLRGLALQIEGLSDVEFREPFGHGAKQTIQSTQRVAAPRKPKTPDPTVDDIAQFTVAIEATLSRDDAIGLINASSQFSTRANLEKLARFSRVHVTKQDNRETLVAKIVEALVGNRLNSQAILGLNFKR